MTSRRLRSRRKAQSVDFVYYFFYYSLTSLYDYSLASLYEVFFYVQYSELPICISNLVLRQRAHLLFLDIYSAGYTFTVGNYGTISNHTYGMQMPGPTVLRHDNRRCEIKYV